ncbi:hypothetical protein JCM33374_g2750 [Metschnikowia sp. JCM 33374]|nr:hypothetical protein JCM33374_g2750 [Metschnikowia sp. JCM 33374]
MRFHSAFIMVLSSVAAASITTNTQVVYDSDIVRVMQSIFKERGRNLAKVEPNNNPSRPVNESQIIQNHLELFVENLKSYIYFSHFDFYSFCEEQEALAQDLLAIGDQVKKVKSLERGVSKAYIFAKTILWDMMYASLKLKQYNASEGKEYTLLTQMIELNIRLLILRTSQGKLDRSVTKYAINLRIFWNEMCCWNTQFVVMENLPVEMRILFENYMSHAKDTILSLWREIPGEKGELCCEES